VMKKKTKFKAIEEPQTRVYDIETLSAEEKNELSKRFAQSKGEFLVLVHPFHSSTDSLQKIKELEDIHFITMTERERTQYLKNLSRKLQANTKPVVAYVEESKIESFKELTKSWNPRNPIIIIKTPEGRALPVLSKREGASILRKTLRELGGKEYEITGETAEYRKAVKKRELAGGCVRGAERSLSFDKTKEKGESKKNKVLGLATVKGRPFKGKPDHACTFPDGTYRKHWEAGVGTKKTKKRR
jgi:hypothetical protein